MSRTRLAATALVVSALALTGCSPATRRAAPHSSPVTAVSPAVRLAALTTFGDCDGLLAAVKREAAGEVGAGGLSGGMGYRSSMQFAMGAGSLAGGGVAESKAVAGGGVVTDAAGASAGVSATGAGGFSTTNNQEVGVDEPDLAKTDGHVLALVRHNPFGLQVMTVDAGTPRSAGFLELSRYVGDAQLFLAGSLVVAVGSGAVTAGAAAAPGTVAVVVDIADPSRPQVVRTFRVPGGVVDARMLAGRVVLVVQRWPDLPFRWSGGPGPAALDRVVAHNRAIVSRSGLADWLPPVTTTPTGHSFAPACDATWHAAKPQGVGTVDVVSFDPADEASVHQTTILGTASVVYASTTGLYLATNDWQRGGVYREPTTTRIHAFDLHDPASPRYIGSGLVDGQIVDQYSLSEYRGDLRVATTVGTAIPAPGEGAAPRISSDSRVTVLRPVDHALVQVGQVRGLGRGERIYGVRFLDELGYVVTFRQIDPLFVLDLSDPAHPLEVAHLRVTGYSAYLHPLGDGLLFGLGRRVDDRAHPTGEQLSVFDVSAPASPSLRSRLYVDGATSPAEYDHHTFLWWAKDRLVVVPMYGERISTFDIAVYHVSDTGVLERVGAVRPPAGQDYPGIERSLVIGDLLYVVSDQGVLASNLYSLKQVAWIPFR